ncbi:hypothetical protein MKEN_00159200 [Mycena kentingensis (nom. inval.)]|nr:hypothetical protein MKEN_00159200 [Mycena kentingensis (nom. inval.)]
MDLATKLRTNYRPTTEAEIHQLKAMLSEKAKRLEALRDAKIAFQTALSKLLAEEAVLRADYDEHKRLLAPIRRLPPEMLQLIFIACLSGRNCIMSRQTPPLVLGRVCSEWRHISQATPQLWSRLHVVEPEDPSSVPERRRDNPRLQLRADATRTWLSRSGLQPLCLSLDGVPNGVSRWKSPRTEILLDALIEFSPRWRHLSVSISRDCAARLLALAPPDVPLLQTLHLTHPHDPVGTYNWTTVSMLSVLRGFSTGSTRAFNFDQLPLAWSNLTYISLATNPFTIPMELNSNTAIIILNRCPALEAAELAIRQLPVTSETQTAVCPCLHTFKIYISNASPRGIVRLLDRLSFPILRTLSLHGVPRVDENRRDSNDFTRIFSQYSALTALSIGMSILFKGSFSQILRAMPPSIERLHILASHAIRVVNGQPETRSALDDDTLALLGANCASLRELVIRSCFAPSDEAIIRFIADAPALRRVEIDFEFSRQPDECSGSAEEVQERVRAVAGHVNATLSYRPRSWSVSRGLERADTLEKIWNPSLGWADFSL